jgi:hypothetical protein
MDLQDDDQDRAIAAALAALLAADNDDDDELVRLALEVKARMRRLTAPLN